MVHEHYQEAAVGWIFFLILVVIVLAVIGAVSLVRRGRSPRPRR